MKRAATAGTVILLILLCIPVVMGQSFQGGLRGTVRDASRAVLPGVSMTLTNEATNLSRATVTNDVGDYSFPAVVPGTYTLSATLQGFKTFEGKGIAIGTQAFITFDVGMETGAPTEEVSVTADVTGIETSNASLGGSLNKLTLDVLPSQNRNAFLMTVTLPTVVTSGDASYTRMQDQTGASSVSLGGGGVRANNYLLDGVSFAALDNRPAMFPGIESLEEMKLQVHTYDAEMGRTGGGVFNATGRSGSNQWHGSGFVQARPNWAAANGFFAQRAGIPKATDSYYYYGGGSVGGPIIKNKTFFWATTEDYRDRRGADGSLIFPTDRERRGDFSQTFDSSGKLVIIYDPLTTRPNPNGSGSIRDPFKDNIIPQNRLSKVGAAVASLFPVPDVQRSGADGKANYTRRGFSLSKGYQGTGKVEHKFTDKVSLTGMYGYQNTTEPNPAFWGDNQPADPSIFSSTRIVHLLALNNTIVASDNTVITLRYGYYRYTAVTPAPDAGYDLTKLGFPASYANSVSFKKVPAMSIVGTGEIGGGFANRALGPNSQSNDLWYSSSFNGAVSKLVGRHTFKFGGDYRKLGLNNYAPGQGSGSFYFDRQYTQGPNPLVAASNAGNGLASLLLGYPSGDSTTVSSVVVTSPQNVFVHYYAGYVQDDFRLSSKVTVNFGLRYEFETGLQEKKNRFTVAFDRSVVSPLAALTHLDLHGGLRYAGQDGYPTYQGDPSKTKFAPRGGVAWTVTPSTVLRGGYGLFYAPWNYQSPGTVNYGQVGYSATTPYNTGTSLIPRVVTSSGLGGLDDPFSTILQPVANTQGLLTGAGTNIDFVDQNRQSPLVQQWSVDLQRELFGGSTVLSFGYMGARGAHLSLGGSAEGLVNINQLDPKHLSLGLALTDQVPNPFYGISQAGPFASSATISRGQLLRPFPQFGNINARQVSAGRSMYHALVLEVNRRFSGGLGGRGSYTWSRLKDNQFGQGNYWSRLNSGAYPENSYNLDAEYSHGLLDMTHRIVMSPYVDLPFGTGKRWLSTGIGRALLGSWTVSAVGTYEGGFPLNVVQSNNNTGSLGGTQRPNLVTTVDPNTAGNTMDRLNSYINQSAYSAAAPYTFGNAPRTDARIRTPWRTNWDMTLARSVKIGEVTKMQLRLELLNLTNSVRFSNGPEARLGNPSFGRLTSQGGLTRRAQLTLRVTW